jgi:Domain of unknown function (DUF4945)
MKKILFYISILYILIFSGCTKDSILDSKPGEPINPVTNLNYTIVDTNVNLTWNLPSSIPADIVKPVSIYIQVRRDNVPILSVTLKDAAVSYVYDSYDSSRQYIIIVKVMGSVDTTDPNVSNLRYSLGNSVSF